MKEYIKDLIMIHYAFKRSQMVEVNEAIDKFLLELEQILHWSKEDQDEELKNKVDYE